MLVITASINHTLIDTILIQNVGLYKQTGLYQYVIRQPEGYEDVILHNREEGYRVLLESVLRCINQEESIQAFIKPFC